MQDGIEEMIEFLYTLDEDAEQDISEQEVLYLAHMFVGIIYASDEAREEMGSHIQRISDIIVADLDRIYN